MHDDDSARMVVLARRGWLGAKTCKLDERGLGKIAYAWQSSSIIKRISKEFCVHLFSDHFILWKNWRLHLVSTFTHDELRRVSKKSLEIYRRDLIDKVPYVWEKKKKKKRRD